jgi:hypothetical protein
MRIGAKNSTPARDRKRFLFSIDAEKGFISSVCATPGTLRRRATDPLQESATYKNPEKQGSTCTDETALTECFCGFRACCALSAQCARMHGPRACAKREMHQHAHS